MSDWVFDHFGLLLAGFIVLVTLGIVLAVVLSGGKMGCPKGEHSYVVTYVPITVGKVITMDPIFGCER